MICVFEFWIDVRFLVPFRTGASSSEGSVSDQKSLEDALFS